MTRPSPALDQRPVVRGNATTAAPSSTAPDGHATEWRPPDLAAVQECLTLLARAVRQFHTYPDTSPLCLEAMVACQKALVGLHAREHLAFRVMPNHLVVDEIALGAGTVVASELAHRLHRAHVASVEIARAIRTRDLTRFCKDLSGLGEARQAAHAFPELLAEHGVCDITVHPAHRPEVLDVGPLHPPVQRLVDHEKQRRQALFASGGPVHHLYPPDKGWVRVDPSATHDSFSLVDLAVLIDNPAEIAVALMRLTGDETQAAHDSRAAFEHKFSDLTAIFSAVDPRLARQLFSKLSRAVLELDPDRHSRLLKRTVLPGLLDGKLEGSVLGDFPDVELAEALCLLLDLETASPDVLTTALDRLGLPPERRQNIVPLLEARLNRTAPPRPDAYGHDHAIESYARRLVALKPGEARSFAEYTAFNLSVTEDTKSLVGQLVDAIGTTDLGTSQLETRLRLVRLEPNPELVAAFMELTLKLFEDLEGRQQWSPLAEWAAKFNGLAVALRDTRPDAADAVCTGLARFGTVARAVAIADLYNAGGEPRARALALADGFGAALADAFLSAVDAPAAGGAARPLVALMTERAQTFAPVLAGRLRDCGTAARHAIVRVLGAAGAMHAPAVIALLPPQDRECDEATGREALRALARMATPTAAAAVAACLTSDVAWLRLAAEEALWHFPAPMASAQVRTLLADREFALSHPDVAGRLLERAAQAGISGLAPVLQALAPLRFRFWNPALVRVTRKAQHLLLSGRSIPCPRHLRPNHRHTRSWIRCRC